jgi:hypothetical protein
MAFLRDAETTAASLGLILSLLSCPTENHGFKKTEC